MTSLWRPPVRSVWWHKWPSPTALWTHFSVFVVFLWTITVVFVNAADSSCDVVVVTLRQRANESNAAEIVFPNCTTVTLTPSFTDDGTTSIDASYMGIEAVTSFPKTVELILAHNAITSIAESDDEQVNILDLSYNHLTSLENLSLPPGVNDLRLDGNTIADIPADSLSTRIVILSLQQNQITSLTDFHFGKDLTSLDLSDNLLTSLSDWEMPTGLQTFICQNCSIETISGVVFPTTSSLQTLDLSDNKIQSFEISESGVKDIEIATELEVPTTSITSCSDNIATLTIVRSISLCVLLDEDFDEKYNLTPISTATSTNSDSSSGSSNEANGSQNSTISAATKSNSTHWMLLAVISVAVLLVVVLSVVGFVLYRRKRLKKTVQFDNEEFDDGHKSEQLLSESDSTLSQTAPARGSSLITTAASGGNSIVSEYLPNDIRTDQELQPFRLHQREVVRGKLLAKGGYGVVYLAKFRNETVVVKQLLPTKTRKQNTKQLMSFMDEIRLCSTLEHPKIVKFLGVTWSSLLDITMVMEFMPHGDLSTLLMEQLHRETSGRASRSDYGWFHSNVAIDDGTKSHKNHHHQQPPPQLKCKSLVALDIAEAMVYLHSFQNPIIHRDLKPKNVLLSANWEAKLTDFGVSREMTEDQTMTGEIGTVSWIAPEVLRGERYSEKADVYSFGVILTELDTCRRPYSDGIPINSDDNNEESNNNSISGAGSSSADIDRSYNSQQHTNTRIAVLVSSGALKPSVHPDCPRSVRRLVDQCLLFDPHKRPTAVQIHYELRNLELGEEELAAVSVFSGGRRTGSTGSVASSQGSRSGSASSKKNRPKGSTREL